MQLHVSDSAQQAQAILGALQTGDAERLHRELERVKHLDWRTTDPAESERMELLCEIARELRAANASPVRTGSDVYCSLLQHLAGSGMKQRRAAIAPWAAAPQSTPLAIVLQ